MKKVVICGAGGFGRRLGESFRACGIEVAAYLDRHACGDIDGVPIRRLEDARDLNDLPVAIGIFNPAIDPALIASELAAVAFREVWSPVTALRKLALSGVTFSQYWLTNEPGIEARDAQLIDEIAGRWADEKSRRIYRSLLAYRSSGDLRELPRSEGVKRQYFPADVPLNFDHKIVFVDGGAYVGDTLHALVHHGVKIDTAYAFEPDPVNYRLLASSAKSLAPMTVVSFPCGVGLANSQVRFVASGQANASVSELGDITVQLVAIDRALAGRHVDYIKLDVEGSELDALKGAEETIRASKPRLAISAYHRPDDLWKLADWILKLDMGYALYLRPHGFQGFDSVIYAV